MTPPQLPRPNIYKFQNILHNHLHANSYKVQLVLAVHL
jgi:hypothetical protein